MRTFSEPTFMWTISDLVFMLTFWAGICGNLFWTGILVKHSESVFNIPSYINVNYYEPAFKDVDIDLKLSCVCFHVENSLGRHLWKFLFARIWWSSLNDLLLHMNLLSQHLCKPFLSRYSSGSSLTRHSHKFHWVGLRGTTLNWHSCETFLLTFFFSEPTSILILFVLLNILGWFNFILAKVQTNLSS